MLPMVKAYEGHQSKPVQENESQSMRYNSRDSLSNETWNL